MMKQENTKIVGKNGIEIVVPLTDKNKENVIWFVTTSHPYFAIGVLF